MSCASERTEETNIVIAFEGECCCLGTQSCSTIIQKYLAQGFQNDHNISDAVERDQSAASQVIPSHRAKSHYFFNALGGIYSQNAFPSPIIRINPFSHKSKPPQASVKKKSPKLRHFYSKCGVSITRFSCDTSKRALKQDDGNIAIVFILEVTICQYTSD